MEKPFLTALTELVAIKSVRGEPALDAPFGEELKKALNYMLELGKAFGFQTVNYDNYIGEIIFGQGEDSLGVLCHLDVVPIGSIEKWSTPPFCLTEKEGKLFGRGVLDDKAAALSILYCMKELKELGFKPRKTIKLILGCNEESGWRCIDRYKKVAKMPQIGFSPDASFPVIFAEKGILNIKLLFEKPNDLKYISGGSAINMVCDRCEAIAPIKAELLSDMKIVDGKIVSFGVSAHGSTAKKGVNALIPMLSYLEQVVGLDKNIKNALFFDSLNLTSINDETGSLTLSPNLCSIEDNYIAITIDLRYPATKNPDEIISKLSKIAPYKILHHQKPLYADKNGELVKTLLNIYNEETGEKREAVAIGGGTYARALPLGVAFGPATDREEESVHQPNEFITLKTLSLMHKVYLKALERLAK